MDNEAINPAKGPSVQASKPKTPSENPAPSAPPADVNPASDDTVSLSPAAKEALEDSTPEIRDVRNPKSETADPNLDKSRELQVTDSNEVILKIIDKKTREVVKQIPSEEEIQLKNAIRDGIEHISTETNPIQDLT